MSLTSEARQRIREAIDARVRSSLPSEPRYNLRHGSRATGCSACGCDLSDWTLGCSTCQERHRAYHKRMHYPNGEAWFQTRKDEHRLYHRNGSGNGHTRYA